jgi:hypothetical protein
LAPPSFDQSKDDLIKASDGVDVIVHGWNPPYAKWQAQVPLLTQEIIAAAQESGATVLVPFWKLGRHLVEMRYV